jgi:hypothetical protein
VRLLVISGVTYTRLVLQRFSAKTKPPLPTLGLLQASGEGDGVGGSLDATAASHTLVPTNAAGQQLTGQAYSWLIQQRFRALRRPSLATAASATLQVTGEGDGVGGSTGNLTELAAFTGNSGGVGGSTGTLAEAAAVTGTSAGVGGSTGTLAETAAITGSSAGIGGSTGTLAAADAITGSSAGVGGSTGTLAAADALTGSSAGVGGSTGTLAEQAALTGEGDGTGASLDATSGSHVVTLVVTVQPGLQLQGYAYTGLALQRFRTRGRQPVVPPPSSVLQVIGEGDGVGGSTGALTEQGALTGEGDGVGGSAGTLTEAALLTGEGDGVGSALDATSGSHTGPVVATMAAGGQLQGLAYTQLAILRFRSRALPPIAPVGPLQVTGEGDGVGGSLDASTRPHTGLVTPMVPSTQLWILIKPGQLLTGFVYAQLAFLRFRAQPFPALSLVAGALSGEGDGIGGSTGTLTEKATLTGNSGGVGGSTGTLSAAYPHTGTAAGVGGSTGTLAETAAVTGTGAALAGYSAALTAAETVTGSSGGTGGSTGTLSSVTVGAPVHRVYSLARATSTSNLRGLATLVSVDEPLQLVGGRASAITTDVESVTQVIKKVEGSP